VRRYALAGWRQVAVLMLNQAAAPGTIILCFSVIARPLQKEYAASHAALGLIMTVTYLITGLANPLLGAAMDHYSVRRILLGGAVCLAVGYCALSFATSMTWVLLSYGLFLAPANATLGPLSYSTVLPRWFERKRAKAVGITVLGYGIGGLLLPLLFQFLIDTFGWRDALRLFAACVAVLVIPAIGGLVVDRPADLGLYPDGDAHPPPTSPGKRADEPQPTSSLLRNTNFWVITLSIGLIVSGAAGVLGNMVQFVISRGFTARQGAFVLSCFSAGSLSSKLLYSLIGDRLNPRVALAAGLFLFTVSSVCLLGSYTYPALLTSSFLHGMAVGVALPLWSYLTPRVFGTGNVGRVFGLMTIVMTPFSLLAPPGLGRIFDLTGRYDAGLILYTGIALLTFMLVPRLRIAAPPRAPNAVAR
jgi:sugar phosphate permease